MSETVDVLLYGLGAIGSFYAFILQNNSRVRLSVCARSNYEAVKNNGVTIRSQNHGEHNFKPVKVLRSLEKAQQTYDYVVCVNKAINTDAVLKQLAPVVGEQTTIALMQNGVGNEDPFRKAFPKSTIVSGVVSPPLSFSTIETERALLGLTSPLQSIKPSLTIYPRTPPP